MKVTGKCFCGAVRYRATVSAKDVSICYCGDCTRVVGSALTTWAHLPADDFEFCEGTPTRFESSPGITRTFCGRCGTSLTYIYKDRTRVDVTTSSFDEPGEFSPNSEGPSRPPWVDALAAGRMERGD